MNRTWMAVLGLLAVWTAAAPAQLDGQVARAAARGLVRGVERSVARVTGKVLRREAARDAATAARPLAAKCTVFRFTTGGRARLEQRRGLRPGAHMTSKAAPGRPPSAAAAQRRYGLPQPPAVRETITLPRGAPVRFNRAWRGQRGVGELTSPERLPPTAIRRFVRLRR